MLRRGGVDVVRMGSSLGQAEASTVELTSPWEENLIARRNVFESKETGVHSESLHGWDVPPLCVELAARGFVNNKWGAMTKAVRIKPSGQKRFRRSSSEYSGSTLARGIWSGPL